MLCYVMSCYITYIMLSSAAYPWRDGQAELTYVVASACGKESIFWYQNMTEVIQIIYLHFLPVGTMSPIHAGMARLS